MPYTLGWYKPEQVLTLMLDGQLSLQELEAINQEVTDALESHETKLSILIDMTNMQTGYHTAEMLRSTQKYMDDPRLDSAFIVAENKLNRLITLMAFCTARATFIQFNSMEMAEHMLSRRDFAR